MLPSGGFQNLSNNEKLAGETRLATRKICSSSAFRLAAHSPNKQRGAVSILTALLLPVVVLVLVLAIDVSYALSEKSRLQGVADNAARAAVQIAGIQGVTSPAGYPMVRDEALGVASANGVSGTSGAAITVNWPYGTNAKAVEVIISKNVGLFYGQTLNLPFFGDVSVRAVADSGQLPCLAALNPLNTGSTGIEVKGGAIANAPCGIYSNRPDPKLSVSVGGNSVLTGKSLYMVGNSDSVTTSSMPYIYPNSPLYKNPFQSRMASTGSIPGTATAQTLSGQCVSGGLAGNTLTINPGAYTSGLSLVSTAFASGQPCANTTAVTMNPGTYYVSGGNFDINTDVSITGQGVTIVLIGNADFSFTKGTLDITAPVAGDYPGISIIGNGVNGGGGGSGLQSSGVTIGVGGAIVLPNKNFKIAGGSTTSGSCFSLIANSITISGSFSIGKACEASSSSQSEQKTWRLVE